jgi:hypothetical protein
VSTLSCRYVKGRTKQHVTQQRHAERLCTADRLLRGGGLEQEVGEALSPLFYELAFWAEGVEELQHKLLSSALQDSTQSRGLWARGLRTSFQALSFRTIVSASEMASWCLA